MAILRLTNAGTSYPHCGEVDCEWRSTVGEIRGPESTLSGCLYGRRRPPTTAAPSLKTAPQFLSTCSSLVLRTPCASPTDEKSYRRRDFCASNTPQKHSVFRCAAWLHFVELLPVFCLRPEVSTQNKTLASDKGLVTLQNDTLQNEFHPEMNATSYSKLLVQAKAWPTTMDRGKLNSSHDLEKACPQTTYVRCEHVAGGCVTRWK
jgi:hypothetical protein